MPNQEFHLEVTNESVFVRLNVSGKARFYALALFAGLTALVMCALLFLSGKHGNPSMWHSLSTSSFGSSDFLFPFFLLLGLPFLLFVLSKRYLMMAYPSPETLRCDRSTLCTSRVHWLDAHNDHWEDCSFSLAEVREIRYRTIATLRGYSIYGIRFKARGKTRRVLPGLKPRDAEKLLLLLKTFGADAPDAQVASSELKEGDFA